jgi:hypothetical protein
MKQNMKNDKFTQYKWIALSDRTNIKLYGKVFILFILLLV